MNLYLVRETLILDDAMGARKKAPYILQENDATGAPEVE